MNSDKEFTEQTESPTKVARRTMESPEKQPSSLTKGISEDASGGLLSSRRGSASASTRLSMLSSIRSDSVMSPSDGFTEMETTPSYLEHKLITDQHISAYTASNRTTTTMTRTSSAGRRTDLSERPSGGFFSKSLGWIVGSRNTYSGMDDNNTKELSAKAQKAVSKVKESVKDLESQTQAAATELDVLRRDSEKADRYKRDLDLCNKRIVSILDEHSRLKQVIDNYQNNLNDQSREHSKELASLQRSLKEREVESFAIRSQLDEALRHSKKLKPSLSTSEVSDLQDRLLRAETENRETRNKLMALDAENKSLAMQLVAAEETASRDSGASRRLMAGMEDESHDLTEIGRNLANIVQKQADFETHSLQLRDRNAQEMSNLLRDIKEAQGRLEMELARNKSLEENIASREEEIKALNEQLKSIRSQVHQQMDNDELRKFELLEQHLRGISDATVKQLELELAHKDKRLSDLENLTKQVDHLLERNKALEIELTRETENRTQTLVEQSSLVATWRSKLLEELAARENLERRVALLGEQLKQTVNRNRVLEAEIDKRTPEATRPSSVDRERPRRHSSYHVTSEEGSMLSTVTELLHTRDGKIDELVKQNMKRNEELMRQHEKHLAALNQRHFADLKARDEHYSQELGKRDSQIDTLQQQLAAQRAREAESLKSALAEYRNEVESRVRRDFADATAEFNSSLKAKNALIERLETEREQVRDELTRKIQELQMMRARDQEALKNREAEMQLLLKQKEADLENRIQVAVDKALKDSERSNQAELSKLRDKHKTELADQAANLESQYRHVIEGLKNDLNMQRNAVTNSRADAESYAKTIVTKMEEQWTNQSEEFNSELENIQKELQSKMEDLKKEKEVQAALQKRIDALTGTVVGLEGANALLREKLNSLDSDVGKERLLFAKTVEELREKSKNDGSSDKLKELLTQLDEACARVSRNEKAWKAESQKLMNDLQQKKNDLDRLLEQEREMLRQKKANPRPSLNSSVSPAEVVSREAEKLKDELRIKTAQFETERSQLLREAEVAKDRAHAERNCIKNAIEDLDKYAVWTKKLLETQENIDHKIGDVKAYFESFPEIDAVKKRAARDLHKQVSNACAEIEKRNQMITELTRELQDLKQQSFANAANAVNSETIATLREQLRVAKTELSELQIQKAGLDRSIETLHTNIQSEKEARAAESTVLGNAQDMVKTLMQRLGDAENEISKLRSKTRSLGTNSSNVDDILRELDLLLSIISQHEASMDAMSATDRERMESLQKVVTESEERVMILTRRMEDIQESQSRSDSAAKEKQMMLETENSRLRTRVSALVTEIERLQQALDEEYAKGKADERVLQELNDQMAATQLMIGQIQNERENEINELHRKFKEAIEGQRKLEDEIGRVTGELGSKEVELQKLSREVDELLQMNVSLKDIAVVSQEVQDVLSSTESLNVFVSTLETLLDLLGQCHKDTIRTLDELQNLQLNQKMHFDEVERMRKELEKNADDITYLSRLTNTKENEAMNIAKKLMNESKTISSEMETKTRSLAMTIQREASTGAQRSAESQRDFNNAKRKAKDREEEIAKLKMELQLLRLETPANCVNKVDVDCVTGKKALENLLERIQALTHDMAQLQTSRNRIPQGRTVIMGSRNTSATHQVSSSFSISRSLVSRNIEQSSSSSSTSLFPKEYGGSSTGLGVSDFFGRMFGRKGISEVPTAETSYDGGYQHGERGVSYTVSDDSSDSGPEEVGTHHPPPPWARQTSARTVDDEIEFNDADEGYSDARDGVIAGSQSFSTTTVTPPTVRSVRSRNEKRKSELTSKNASEAENTSASEADAGKKARRVESSSVVASSSSSSLDNFHY